MKNLMTKTIPICLLQNLLLLIQHSLVEAYTFTSHSFINLPHRHIHESHHRQNNINSVYSLSTTSSTKAEARSRAKARLNISSLSTTISDNNTSTTESTITRTTATTEEKFVRVSFSHVHIYTDYIEPISIYKELENQLNTLVQEVVTKVQLKDDQVVPVDQKQKQKQILSSLDVKETRLIWKHLQQTREQNNDHDNEEDEEEDFIPQGRDIIKQLIAGLGFRITGEKYIPNQSNNLVLTTKDSTGVQFVISSLDNNNSDSDTKKESQYDDNQYIHFNSKNIDQFYKCHSNRQGIAVLAFSITSGSIENLYQRYLTLHPQLLVEDYKNGAKTYYVGDSRSNDTINDDTSLCKVLEVYSYYQDEKGGDIDKGTKLRFVQYLGGNDEKKDNNCYYLPGIVPIHATFDETCMSAYCDHWVSNVISRTGFIETLEETLGFTPKVDFNAGVVAAGEAQIESTVTGNDSKSVFKENHEALRDQSQVYLPINNALSDVGHVHGFLKEIGQGIQHIASRVDDLPAFVQRANDFRKITGEGLTFLKIPRSYYGVLTTDLLKNEIDGLSHDCAFAIIRSCEECPNVMTTQGAIDLDITPDKLLLVLQSSIEPKYRNEFNTYQHDIIHVILQSRYTNLYNLLGDNLSTDTYLAIVKNQILVDVQGNDLLFQIFTSNILQRKLGDESPFLEFIQRVCSRGGGGEGNNSSSLRCPVEMKAGCGGFGIRNFLTLFLSIEVGKAMLDVSRAKEVGDVVAQKLAEKKVSIFTDQLNESNPILTAISDAMTEEGNAMSDLENAIRIGDEEAAKIHRTRMKTAQLEKNANNEKLMACSTKYNELMKVLRNNATTK